MRRAESIAGQIAPAAVLTAAQMGGRVGLGALAPEPTHISICVCTFKRPDLLNELFQGLLRQDTAGKFTYSIIVVDNDRQESSRAVTELFQCTHPGVIKYFVEPQQSIALARNRTVANASGEFVAFIDDDESPVEDWLLKMHAALIAFDADGVLGPVKPRFTVQPPQYILRSGVFDRPNSRDYQTGLVLHWKQTGTGNVLIRRSVLEQIEGPFRRQFGSGGEDVDFFRRAMELGKVFVWCNEGTAYETVPTERTRISFQLKRALLRGKVSLESSAGKSSGILKSVVACGVYTMLLPAFLVLGRHLFLKYLFKNCDHLGKLMAFCRINVVKEQYVVK
jgi:succinoglycan biosynthesis protein ExoM